SVATPPEGVVAEIVVHRGPINEGDVEPGAWADKILLTDQFPMTVAAAAHAAGATGLISDCVSPPWLAQYPPVREPADVPDLVMWTTFRGTREQPPMFGFNLSPRQGQRLRQLIRTSDEPVQVRAVVDAEMLEGSSDLVNAAIPGTDLADEEIWVLAHLSEPGARDNASGCCLSLELARTFVALAESGALPPLRRTVRFMHAVEVEGFLPYITAHQDRLPRVVAGLCADSVAQDFNICGGEMVLFRSPEHNASFVDGLLGTLLDAVRAEPNSRFSDDNYASYPWHAEPFFGNDAFISDGFFDIPTPQLSSWPDRFYHSSMDTPDQINALSLGKTATAMGTMLYLLANAGPNEAAWFGALAMQDFKRRICDVVAQAVTVADPTTNTASEILHLGMQGADAVMQADRFAPDDERAPEFLGEMAEEVRAYAEREAVSACAVLAAPCAPLEQCPPVEGETLVAKRLRWQVPLAESLPVRVEQALGELSGGSTDLHRIWPWINGRRSAREIHERLGHGGSLPLAVVVRYLELMAEAGMVELDRC
ncbi:MAG TPA: hypothetical protein QGH10_08650, partial [Armatimonadota bacterium]|nr:hypothetical protein [Armatimonadota bacterium]